MSLELRVLTRRLTADSDKKEEPKPDPTENGDPAPTTQEVPKQDEPKPQEPAATPTDKPAVPELAARDEPRPQETASIQVEEPAAPPAEAKEEPKAVPAATEEKKEESQPAADTSNTDNTGAVEPKDHAQISTHQTNGDAVEPKAREEDVPSSILEKGIIYFFFRARVNVEDPQDVQDIARSYFVLRPIPHGAKLGDGTIGDANNSRLIALPKKVLPVSGKDKFMVFVEKAKSSFATLKEDFMSASDYATKTAGTSHSPAVTPFAEGIYAITTTGRESHLAYMITIPNELGEVQKDVGLKESGSFVVSAKNPKFPGPANTNIGKDPGFSEEIISEFRDLRWMPLQPKLLDYEGTQFLLIGEDISSATEHLPRDEKQDKDTPMEEMEKLEGEDEIRVKHLKGKHSPLFGMLYELT